VVEDFRIKLNRADEHLQAIDRVFGQFLAGQPYSVIREPDPDAPPDEPRQLLKARIARHAMPEWSAVIGDCIHNLRSALDNLAFALAGAQAGDRTEFPIFLDKPKFEERTRRGDPTSRSGLAKMTGIPKGAQDVIKALQPYARPHGLPARAEPLWVLQGMDIEDKHHRLLVVGAATMPPPLLEGTAGDRSVKLTWYVPSGWIFRNDGDVLDSIPVGDPKNEPHFTFDVAFDPKGPALGVPVHKALADCRNAVEEAILLLEPFL
jgi:hypothetical protein